MKQRNDIRNIAIIAHVDHGKTTLVDALLKQSHVFRENQAVVDCVMDSNPQERERGITIMAKNTAVTYNNIKINIIDTPGHADFSGEVERVISMADGCLLLVDAVEGPMPQTKYVLKQAFKAGLKPIVVINKIDRENARIPVVLHLIQDLFLELATTDDQLDFPVLYASGRQGIVVTQPDLSTGTDVSALFDAILANIPAPKIEDGPFQMMISNLDYDSHKGKIAIGRIFRGAIKPKERVVCLYGDGSQKSYQINEVMTYMGLKRVEVEGSEAGDIVAVTGVAECSIGDTLASPDKPEALHRIEIGEPTVEMTFAVNTSPFSGREGKFSTTRQIRDRLYRELETNLSLRVSDTDSSDTFLVKGRGELHLAVLIESMRREGYEFQVSKPEAITKTVDGVLMEPVELLSIDVRQEYVGAATEMLGQRQAEMRDMHNDGKDNVHMEFRIPTKGLIGFRSAFITATRGGGVMNSVFTGFEPFKKDIVSQRSAVLVSAETGETMAYGLNVAQERGQAFVGPGVEVYEGMIIGTTMRGQDIAINVCKEKKKTNIRSSTSDIAVKLSPPIIMSLEQSIDFINRDELVEVTPTNIRLRKKILSETMRLRDRKASERDE
jgi:GTP-binding protein